jgi:DNA-binding transcriptional ArsR family regulator
MVKYSSPALDATFNALAHPTRRAILLQLARHDTSVQDLARPLRVSLPAITKHLTVLEQGGLITTEKYGRVRTCRLVLKPLQDATTWLDFYRQFWETRLDGLGTFLQSNGAEE